MNLLQNTDYALRIVFDFSRLEPGTYLTIDEISEKAFVPLDMIANIMKKLENAQIVVSPPPAGGGYRLARPRQEITLYDVIIAIEGNVTLNNCLNSTSLCNAGRAPICKVHRALGTIQENLFGELKAHNFENI